MKPILLAGTANRMALAALKEHGLASDGQFAWHGNCLSVVALLDLKVPKLDRLEVLWQMKADPALKTVPVVVLRAERDMCLRKQTSQN